MMAMSIDDFANHQFEPAHYYLEPTQLKSAITFAKDYIQYFDQQTAEVGLPFRVVFSYKLFFT